MRALCVASTGDHYPDELEDHLEEFMVDVFHVEAEDGSPAEARARAAAGDAR